MKELHCGDEIVVGDMVTIGKGLYKVVKVDSKFCYVRVNRFTSMRFPNVYSDDFKNTDDIDKAVYNVYRK